MGTVQRVDNDLISAYELDFVGGRDFKKHLKTLIRDNVSGISFVLSKQRNKCENIVLNRELSEALDLIASLINEDNVVAISRIFSTQRTLQDSNT